MHIYDNMKKVWRGAKYKELLWKCATTTTVPQFHRKMEEVKRNNNAHYEWLKQITPMHWTRSHFSGKVYHFICMVKADYNVMVY